MKINFLTLFPKYYLPFTTESIIKRAIEKKIVEINIIDIRDFSTNKHNKIDDKVYGGGKGMLMQVEPIHKAIQATHGHVILLSPQGKRFDQAKAKELSNKTDLVFIAGRYEGVDERVRSFIDEEISIGDYVLTGGELPSMVVADSVIRLIDGVIKKESHEADSFQNNLLDYPQYTRPREYQGLKVPEVILNGNHAEIEKWRKKEQLKKTKINRPDLIKRGER